MNATQLAYTPERKSDWRRGFAAAMVYRALVDLQSPDHREDAMQFIHGDVFAGMCRAMELDAEMLRNELRPVLHRYRGAEASGILGVVGDEWITPTQVAHIVGCSRPCAAKHMRLCPDLERRKRGGRGGGYEYRRV